ncbi:MAG: restriction endonuclease subunit S [Bacteroidetes bacterium]|nr:restriction endonuclease subunit S [Bacteroidota bacterium]MCB0842643.1 restriction endonuclease subunit S [Bacteroidota bacterium]MCB0856193.1 restriction endonuclease subunit S [Bacteroidota bacterium]
MKKLKHLTKIQSGIFAQTGLWEDVIYLQAKYFDDNGNLSKLVKPDLKLDNRIIKYLLREGDILFAGKGTKNFAVLYRETMGPAIASTTFLVIRMENQKKLKPEFLTWWLNHPKSQLYFKTHAKGSSTPLISKKVLGELEVPVPTLKKQAIIGEVQRLWQRKEEIESRITQLEEKITQHQLFMATQKDHSS